MGSLVSVSYSRLLACSRLGLMAGLLLLIACSKGPAESLPTRSGLNVLVISFDAMRADRLGLYGYRDDVSPKLDAFAQRSLVFDAAYVGGQATPTSFATAFTGRYPHRVFRGWTLVGEPTLAEVLRGAGYRTAALLNNVQLVPERHFDRGFDEYEARGGDDERSLTDAAKRWLAEERGEPFFFWVHFISPHGPYKWRAESRHLYDADYRGSYRRAGNYKKPPETPEDVERFRQLYDGETHYVDSLFGELIDHLDSLGLLDNTVVVVTADHGEELMERDVFGHKTLHEEVWRVPLLIFHPDVAIGRRTSIPVVNADLLPTLAGIVGVEAPTGLDGVDVRRLPNDRSILGVAMTNKARRSAAIRRGSRKLIVRCPIEGRPETALFDLATDPREVTDLASAQPQAVTDLFEELKAALGGHPCAIIEDAVKGRPQEEGLSDEVIEELEALGYVG
jgi:arylsulfatase